MKVALELFRYTDHRVFLRDALAELKKTDAKFSQRFIAMKLGLKSSGWLSDVLAGRKNISIELLHSLAHFFEMSQRERAYFETLVFYTQAESTEEKLRHYEHLLTFREVSADLLGKERFEYFSQWYHLAIREWMLVDGYNGNAKALAHHLLPPVSPEEVESSLQLLQQMGMVKKQVGNRWVPSAVHVKKQSDFDRMSYLAHIRRSVEQGMWALEHVPKEERDMSTMSGALSETSYKEICEDIQALRRKIATLSEKETRERRMTQLTDPMRVYQFVFQAFPLTNKEQR